MHLYSIHGMDTVQGSQIMFCGTTQQINKWYISVLEVDVLVIVWRPSEYVIGIFALDAVQYAMEKHHGVPRPWKGNLSPQRGPHKHFHGNIPTSYPTSKCINHETLTGRMQRFSSAIK